MLIYYCIVTIIYCLKNVSKESISVEPFAIRANLNLYNIKTIEVGGRWRVIIILWVFRSVGGI